MPEYDRTLYPAGSTECSKGHDLTDANGCELPSGEFMCRKCRGVMQRTYGSYWKNGRGQVFTFIPDHPMARKDGFYPLAKLKMELKIGRLLEPEERVLHEDGQADNDDPDNLLLFANQRALAQYRAKKYHEKKEALGGGWAALTPAQREHLEIMQLERANDRRIAAEEEAAERRKEALRTANKNRAAAAEEKKAAKRGEAPTKEKTESQPIGRGSISKRISQNQSKKR